MNVFRVLLDRSDDFVAAWRERDSYLAEVPGFQSFHLLEGETEDNIRYYSSHTVWADQASFRAWVESDSFRKAHSQGKLTGILAGPPKFQGWTAVAMD